MTRSLADTLNIVVTLLEQWPLGRMARMQEIRQFAIHQFAFKVRIELVGGSTLQVRLYCNNEHIDYAYQLFESATPIIR